MDAKSIKNETIHPLNPCKKHLLRATKPDLAWQGAQRGMVSLFKTEEIPNPGDLASSSGRGKSEYMYKFGVEIEDRDR